MCSCARVRGCAARFAGGTWFVLVVEAAPLLSNFSVGGCGIPQWWVVAVLCDFVSGFFFTLDNLRALVCFRYVEICIVFGCCFVTTASGCLEAALVFFSCSFVYVVSLLIIDWWDWIWLFLPWFVFGNPRGSGLF